MTPNRFFKYVVDKLRRPSEGMRIDSTWIDSGNLGLGLLVYAQQNSTSPLTSNVATLIPFDTEVLDSQNLFSNGFFTPSVNGLYRFGCKTYFSAPGQLGEHGIYLYQGSSEIGLAYLSESYISFVMVSTQITRLLTAGVPYHIRFSSEAVSLTVGDGEVTIERLS